MSTILKNIRTWRALTLILLLIAMLGPWTYERVYVPPPCTAPNVQVEAFRSQFCGSSSGCFAGKGPRPY